MSARILVCDDERHIVSFVSYNLKQTGYDVAVALSGDEAWRLAQQIRPDAILLDLNMPGMNGREVMKRIRANPDMREIAVVILSARTLDLMDEALGDERPDLVLTKPIAPSRLLDSLESLGLDASKPLERR